MSDFKAIKCTKCDFGWGSAPDPAAGAYSAPPDRLAGFKGPTSKGRGGEGRGEEWRERESGGKEGKGGGRGPISSAGPGPPKHVKTALLSAG